MAENLGPKGEIACFVTLLAAKVHSHENAKTHSLKKMKSSLWVQMWETGGALENNPGP